MKIAVVVAHPNPSSFNHAIAKTAALQIRRQGHELFYHDLYAEKFDPVLPADEIPKNARPAPRVRRHCGEIAVADGMVIVHPNWWGQPPAILTGWIDRVLRPGVAYRFLEGDKGGGVPAGLLKAKTAIVFNTSNTPPRREKKYFGDPLENIWKRCVFDLCGVPRVRRKTFCCVVNSSSSQRKEWLEDVRVLVRREFPKSTV